VWLEVEFRQALVLGDHGHRLVQSAHGGEADLAGRLPRIHGEGVPTRLEAEAGRHGGVILMDAPPEEVRTPRV
jgi:hypothetical protein